MFLNLDVYNSSGNFQGSSRLSLDWEQNVWSLVENQETWQHVGFSEAGSFEVKSWGVLWLWDQGHNTVIFWDAPMNDSDSSHPSGEARIFEPQDESFKEGKIKWTLDTAEPSQSQELSARRRKVIEELLPQVIPSSYGSEQFDLLTGGLRKDNPQVLKVQAEGKHYTTCGSLPAFIARNLGGTGMIAAGGTDGIRQACQNPDGSSKFDEPVWNVADRVQRPRPGDLYGLCTGNNPAGYLVHVGVILDTSGSQWKTADAGQGDGWAATEVTRDYDEENGTLTGEVSGGGSNRPPRLLAGWVDIDKYPFPE